MKPTKPAGCFLQVVAGIILILTIIAWASTGRFGFFTFFFLAIGVAILYWGGTAAREKKNP